MDHPSEARELGEKQADPDQAEVPVERLPNDEDGVQVAQRQSDVREPRMREHRFHYVPGEVAVVVSVPKQLHQDHQHQALYEAVRQQLNDHDELLSLPKHAEGAALRPSAQRLRESMAARRTHSDPFVVDTAPHPKWDEITCSRGLLQRPDRLHGRSARHRPYAVFANPGDGSYAVLFYRIGVDQVHIDNGLVSKQDQARLSRDVVHTVNTRLRRRSLRADDTVAQVVAAMPNWMHAASGSCLSGGPGSAPRQVPEHMQKRPVAARRWRFGFPESDSAQVVVDRSREAAWMEPHAPSDVVVAVLDACPPRGQVHAAADRYNAHPKRNDLLMEVVYGPRRVELEAWPSMSDADFVHVQSFLPNWRGGNEVWRNAGDDYSLRAWRYNIADHGLFVSGIIKDIAPGADVRLIRVMDDAGIGDLQGLMHVLSQLPRLLGGPDDAARKRRLVVNLSLMTDVPTAEDVLPHFFENTFRDHATLQRRWHEISELIQLTHRGLAEVMAWLGRQGVLVVAAAGNDAFRQANRPEERLPARYDYSSDNVIGVAAVNRAHAASGFSNRGDHGIAVLGGDAAEPDGNEPPKIPDGEDPLDAVVGIFSNPLLPFSNDRDNSAPEYRNENGWAYWSGTSFATPIISGLAADVWLDDPTLSPSQVRHMIYGFQSQIEPELHTRAIRAVQE